MSGWACLRGAVSVQPLQVPAECLEFAELSVGFQFMSCMLAARQTEAP